MTQPLCVIVGAGSGNGAAFARQFHEHGFRVALLARNEAFITQLADELENARAWGCDASQEAQVERVFGEIQREWGTVDTLIYNAGTRDFRNIEETDAACLETAWKVNTLGCFLAAKQVIPGMKQAQAGNILIIGATASLSGSAGFTAFASSKAAQRSLAQSMARQLGPQGIHVAYLIIDAILDSPTARAQFPLPEHAYMRSEDLARTLFFLTRQPSSAWTFELDLRPYCEKW